ncbi:MAG: aminotransferase class III [Moraxellaceae bacterium]|nr:MAG: aminotransferase class III [Moraxellaceae bacterium]
MVESIGVKKVAAKDGSYSNSDFSSDSENESARDCSLKQDDSMDRCSDNYSKYSDSKYSYSKYCKPKLAETLHSIGLDQVYFRAQGAYMWYRDAVGEEVKVTDFLGGYGAAIFGHNHPHLVSVLTQAYQNEVPFAAQLSTRSKAGLLGEKLNQLYRKVSGESYLTLQANTGAEAIELAIKHSELFKLGQLEIQFAKLERALYRILENIEMGECHTSKQFREALENKTNIQNWQTPKDAIRKISLYNRKLLARKPCMLALNGAFHGKTSGAVQLTYNEEYRAPFKQMGADVCFVNAGDKDQLVNAIANSMCSFILPVINSDKQVVLREQSFVNLSAFFIEPIQGEGGIQIIPKEYLQFCRQQADLHQIPLVFDEIQSGMGRSGTFLFSEQQGVVADYYLLSKSLGGGLAKISTVSFNEKFYLPEFDLIHSSTFAEDDISSMVAMAALDLILKDDKGLSACRTTGDFILTELKNLQRLYPQVLKDVRGVGLMIGLEFSATKTGSNGINELIRQDNLAYVVAGYLLNEHGVRVAPTLSHGATLRIEPPFVVTHLDCVDLINGLARVCEILQKQNLFELTKYIIGLEDRGILRQPIKDYAVAVSIPVTAPNTASDAVANKSQHIIKVYFIAHLVRAADLKLWDKSLEGFSDPELTQYLEKVYKMFGPSGSSEHIIESITGETVSLNFIGYIIDARLIDQHRMNRDRSFIQDQIQEAVDRAISEGASIIGLGGYTSIVTNNCRNLLAGSVALTSGNSLTVGMGLEGIYQACREKGLKLEESTVAIVGAAGNIASVYAEIIAEQVPRIILIGRGNSEQRLIKVANTIYKNAFAELVGLQSQNRLTESPLVRHASSERQSPIKGIATQIVDLNVIQTLLKYQREFNDRSIDLNLYDQISGELGEDAPVKISVEIESIIEADILLTASNTAEPVIFPNMIKPGGAIICDIALPRDVDPSVVRERPDVSVIKGGLVQLPSNPDFSIKGIPLEPGQTYACMAETVLLGLMGVTNHYSFGSIDKNQVKEMMVMAETHGFKLAQLMTEDSY